MHVARLSAIAIMHGLCRRAAGPVKPTSSSAHRRTAGTQAINMRPKQNTRQGTHLEVPGGDAYGGMPIRHSMGSSLRWRGAGSLVWPSKYLLSHQDFLLLTGSREHITTSGNGIPKTQADPCIMHLSRASRSAHNTTQGCAIQVIHTELVPVCARMALLSGPHGSVHPPPRSWTSDTCT
jgi:hypothetical protein